MLSMRAFLVMYLAGAAAFVWATPVAAQDSGDGGGGGAVVALIIYLAIGGAIAYFMYRNRQSFSVQKQSSIAPTEAIRLAVQTYTMGGWSVTSNTGDNVTFVKATKGSCLVAILLFFLGIIPGILYMAFRGRTMTANVHVLPGPTGSVARIQGNTRGFGGEATARRLAASLP